MYRRNSNFNFGSIPSENGLSIILQSYRVIKKKEIDQIDHPIFHAKITNFPPRRQIVGRASNECLDFIRFSFCKPRWTTIDALASVSPNGPAWESVPNAINRPTLQNRKRHSFFFFVVTFNSFVVC